MFFHRFALLVIAVIGAATALDLRADTYSITDLGTLGGSVSDAYALNSSGHVVGRAATTGNTAYASTLFSTTGNLDLGNFGGEINQANAINSAGVIVGTNSQSGNLSTRAFVALGKTLLDLGDLGGTGSRACAINDDGQITGGSQITNNTATHAFRYQNGAMTDLGGVSATGYGINSAGHVVGQSSFRAFIATANSIVSIGAIGAGNFSAAYAINDSDQIVGESNTVNGGFDHPFLYEGGTMKDLGLLASGDLGFAYAINDSGQIVGSSNLVPNGTTFHAFLSQGGQMTDLNDLISANSGWVLNSAHAINASGQIAGSGTLNGQTRAFLLTPLSSSTTSSVEPPRIYVNGARRVITTRSSLRVEGSVGGTVSAVKYRVGGKGSYHGARGISGWRFRVALRLGRNIVQVIAVSPAGRTSRPAKVVIIRK